ncbi:receptor-type tyrosine-protein phosphatase T-like [Diadema antillarum]|uniref:receptor-type tyrosine-protein phosphatase T-like n=1 Tax=Diadema antillarum TaxID=105358 RepID=UPI003A8AA90B
MESEPHSQYINASFIDGFKGKRNYIAAQGPNSASIDDFWRMVWQYDCRKIVMLTKCVESGKRNGSRRTVVQFHYTSWPDMGVPEYATPLVKFIRVIKEHKAGELEPTIVHGSTGVGRTGTFITLDAMLDQAEEEGVVDIYSFVKNMREQRIKMVQVAEQYEFIFETLMETFTCGDTSITHDDFHQVYPSLSLPSPDTGASVLQEQFAHLDTHTVKPEDNDHQAAKDPANINKNRYQDKIPSERIVHQLELTTWSLAADVASCPESVAELYRRANGLKDASDGEDAPILVHCSDGEGATGSFIAVSSVIDRIESEKVIDVFQACKKLRTVRQGAVASLAQYEFIHAVVKSYLDSTEMYMNF